MRATFAIAALAGSALAAPHYGRPQKEEAEVVKNVHVVVETVVETVYITAPYEPAQPTPAPEPVYEAPAVTTVVYEEPAPEPTYEAAPAPEPTYEAPAPEPTPEAAPAPAPVASGYQGIVDTWRSKMGLKPLANDAKLESNALDCVTAGNGNMVHKLNPGSYGQVLAPGGPDDFEHVFVGGWLCEIPTLPGLDGVCATQSEGWSYQGQTGHAEILTSDNYSKIGCALYNGIWGCDLA
ncbi:hypothetical protein BKA66DRAFT_509925 [Pyrenochaeta sp. MPI-SDFR-AT-0127]|nr:hypothetical protein BKA66DRAFT_509925 [Pyrenochaeta sp. MPI-SDFR-AT-0127]